MDQHQNEHRPGLRILLVDPHERVRESLARRLLMDPRVSSVTDAATVDAIPAIVQAAPPDVVLIDPGDRARDWREGLRALVRLRDHSARFLIAMHVARNDELDETEAAAIGADLLLLKGLRTTELMALLTERLRLD
jgi:DNA-binding NarL/FixJ family response regulator